MIQSYRSRDLTLAEQYHNGMTSILGRRVQHIHGVNLYYPFAHDCTIADGEWLVGSIGKAVKLTDAEFQARFQDP